MRSKWSVTLSKGLLFLIVSFLILSSPLAGKAQNTSVVNVTGTSWDAGSVLLPTPNTGDGAITMRRRLYDFDKQGKVKSTVLIDKSAGGILTYEYNALSGRYENRQTMTMPTSRSETITGTYEIKGKSIYLDFPDYTVRATIYGDSMKGVLTYKSTNEKEEWIVSKKTGSITSSNENQPSSSSSSNQASLKRIMEKYNPTRLTTHMASGELNSENSNKRSWYIFMVVPGELTITLNVEPAPQSSFNSVQFALYDMNESLLVYGGTMAVYGRPNQAVEKVRIADRKPILLRLDFNNLGSGKYRIQLGGAFDNGNISEDKPTFSTVSRDKTDQNKFLDLDIRIIHNERGKETALRIAQRLRQFGAIIEIVQAGYDPGIATRMGKLYCNHSDMERGKEVSQSISDIEKVQPESYPKEEEKNYGSRIFIWVVK